MEGAMAAGEAGLRDASGFCNHLLPPGETGHFGRMGALVDTDRSFLISNGLGQPTPDDLGEYIAVDPDEYPGTSAGLFPPLEYRAEGFRTWDEIIKNRIPTPLDDRGLVDMAKLIEVVGATVYSEYDWPGFTDIHHTMWTRARYEIVQTFYPDIPAVAFRELAINKMLIPRSFHNWVHAVTLPPPVPHEDVMRETVQEWTVIKDFFVSVKEATSTVRAYDRERQNRLQGRSKVGPFTEQQEGLIAEDVTRRLNGVFGQLRDLGQVPLERWPFAPHLRVQAAAGHVGALVLKGGHRRTRAVRRPKDGLKVA